MNKPKDCICEWSGEVEGSGFFFLNSMAFESFESLRQLSFHLRGQPLNLLQLFFKQPARSGNVLDMVTDGSLMFTDNGDYRRSRHVSEHSTARLPRQFFSLSLASDGDLSQLILD